MGGFFRRLLVVAIGLGNLDSAGVASSGDHIDSLTGGDPSLATRIGGWGVDFVIAKIELSEAFATVDELTFGDQI